MVNSSFESPARAKLLASFFDRVSKEEQADVTKVYKSGAYISLCVNS